MYPLRDTTAEDDLAAAARRGVNVRVILDRHLERKFSTASYGFLSSRGVHAKAVVADGGNSAEQLSAGPENFSFSSLRRNRELGIRTTNKPVIAAVATVLADDCAGAAPFR